MRHELAAALGVLALALLFAASRPGRSTPKALRADRARPVAHAPAAAELLFSGRLDLNAATEADLAALPGIGPRRAAAIFALRSERGRFRQVDDLLDVPGI